MISKGVLIRLQAKAGGIAELEQLLRSAGSSLQPAQASAAWFAVHFGQADYGIFNAFSDDAARQIYLNSNITHDLLDQAGPLLAGRPQIRFVDVLANKLPGLPSAAISAKGLFIVFKAAPGRGHEIGPLLRAAAPVIYKERDTVACFAIQLDHDEFGAFAVFRDPSARIRHLTGHVPGDLASNTILLSGNVPIPQLFEVVSEKIEATLDYALARQPDWPLQQTASDSNMS